MSASSVWREPGGKTETTRNSDRSVKCSHTVVWGCLKSHLSESLSLFSCYQRVEIFKGAILWQDAGMCALPRRDCGD